MDNNYNKMEQITAILTKAFNALFIDSPHKTAMGVVLGSVLCGSANLILQAAGSALQVEWWYCMCLGVLIVHFPSLFVKHRFDEELETILHYARIAMKEGTLPEEEIRQYWRRLANLAFKRIEKNLSDPDQEKSGEENDQNHVTPAK